MPKIKKMSDFASGKLQMTTNEDRANIEAVKKKLQSINQDDIKDRIIQKGMTRVVMEEYLHKENFTVDGQRASAIIANNERMKRGSPKKSSP